MSPSKREHSSEEQAVMMAQLRDALSPDVHVNLLKGGEEGVTEATLRRWLAARKVLGWHDNTHCPLPSRPTLCTEQ